MLVSRRLSHCKLEGNLAPARLVNSVPLRLSHSKPWGKSILSMRVSLVLRKFRCFKLEGSFIPARLHKFVLLRLSRYNLGDSLMPLRLHSSLLLKLSDGPFSDEMLLFISFASLFRPLYPTPPTISTAPPSKLPETPRFSQSLPIHAAEIQVFSLFAKGNG